MFGIGRRKKRIAIVVFTKGEDGVAMRIEGEFTKKEVIKKVGEWWDRHGTGLNDYDGIRITAERKGDRHGR